MEKSDLVKRARSGPINPALVDEMADRIEALERDRKYLMTTEQAMRAAADYRREALEEAALAAEEALKPHGMYVTADIITTAIRALMEDK